MDTLYLAIILLLSFSIFLYLIFSSQGICYFGPNIGSNSEKMNMAASKISLMDWPSKMHLIKSNRGQCREYWVIFVRILLKLRFYKRITNHIDITLSLICNLISTILIYFIISNYFNSTIGFIIACIYLGSFWPYHIALNNGHIHLSQLFFLLAILFLQISSHSSYYSLLYFFVGLFTAVSFFSSSASRKYPLMVLIALAYSLKDHLFLISSIELKEVNIILIILFLSFSFILQLSKYFLESYIIILFQKLIPGIRWNIDRVSWLINFLSLLNIILAIIFVFFDLNIVFLISVCSFVFGIILVLLHIFLPLSQFKENVCRFYLFYTISSWASHFNSYPSPEVTFGKKLPKDFRGGDLIWLHKVFLIVMPFLYPLYLSSLVFLIFLSFLDIFYNNNFETIMNLIFLFFISISPIIIHKITKGIETNKAYMAVCCSFLLVIAEGFNHIFKLFDYNQMIYLIAFSILLLHLIYSIFIMKVDTLPCRMAPTNLRKHLNNLGIKEFYTYKTPFNLPFVDTMIYTYPNEFIVNYINSLDDINKGYIVIPSTSSKSVYFESDKNVINQGDFRSDTHLNNLLDNHLIEKIAVAKIKTVGCSRLYVHDSEVTSYRELISKDITDYDRWLGNAWIINREDV